MKLTPREPTPEMAVAGSIALRLTSFADLDATIEEVTAVWRAMHDAAPSGWQPIETAPKDGTRVLLAIHGVPRAVLGFYEFGVWATIDGHNWSGHTVTRWMPLPAPPSEKGE